MSVFLDTDPADDYDTPWKDAVTRYFPEFMAFYFPDASAQIDWARGYTFLDQELAQVGRVGKAQRAHALPAFRVGR